MWPLFKIPNPIKKLIMATNNRQTLKRQIIDHTGQDQLFTNVIDSTVNTTDGGTLTGNTVHSGSTTFAGNVTSNGSTTFNGNTTFAATTTASFTGTVDISGSVTSIGDLPTADPAVAGQLFVTGSTGMNLGPVTGSGFAVLCVSQG